MDDNVSQSFRSNNVSLELSNPPIESIIIPVVFGLIVLVGAIGNVLVLIAVFRQPMRTTTNLFIVNLAVADLLFLIFCAPFHAIVYTQHWYFGEVACKLVHLLQFSAMLASIWTLVTMSADRFLAVSFPVRTKHLRKPRAALISSSLVWVLAVFSSVLWPIVYTIRKYGDIPVCSDAFDSDQKRASTFLLLFVFGYAIPLAVIALLSALLIRQLWKTPMDCSRRASTEAKKKVTRLIVVVVLAFALCWLPSHVFWLYTTLHKLHQGREAPKTMALYVFRMISHVLSYANSAVNPILYAFLSRHFRIAFRRALKCERSNISESYWISSAAHPHYNIRLDRKSHGQGDDSKHL
ncbi:unnamed protein product [Dimorphilus gyrociliatus]|uniref:G-protein coupled receptors family 1 profile domain-containing protein n=1 Tax=Dimorphilus gyrociliatus TaxID=2664684 RepID=A0A7I8W7H7_9ANNE|nr:unnamed protein product [Dimorphilus gyrociliatus]